MRPAHLSEDRTPLISVTQFMMLEMDKLDLPPTSWCNWRRRVPS